MEILKKRYPKKAVLGGRPLVLRPMEASDEKGLLAFFKKIPAEDRLLLKDDVVDAKTVKSWCRSLDYARVLPLLAIDGKKIVGDATLHREQGWMNHVARVRAVVDPTYRGCGLGQALVNEFVEVARELKISMVDAEIMAEQKAGRKMFESLGFTIVAMLPHHALDREGKAHDVVVLSRQIMAPS